MAKKKGGSKRVLLTGATGFIGSRLLAKLLEHPEDFGEIRALSRQEPSQLELPASPGVVAVQGDIVKGEGLEEALAGVDVAYYLIHSMEGGLGEEKDFVERDKQGALNFSAAAAKAGVKQIVYVSGIKPKEFVSDHLKSRNDVEAYLGHDGVPVTVLRAGFIVGPESAGFKMMRGLTADMKTMVMPEYMHHRTQPAYVGDVVQALLEVAKDEGGVGVGKVYEVGSKEVVSYLDIVQSFCTCGGREVNFLEVPWVPQNIASLYISKVSGLSYALVSALAEGLKVDLFVENEQLYTDFPDLPRTPPHRAMYLAWQEAAGQTRA